MPDPSQVNVQNPTAVALAGTQAIESSDTTVDRDPNATTLRAGAWLTPRFLAAVKAYPPIAAPGAQWDAWTSHRAYLAVTTALGGDDQPTDTATSAVRQVVATVTATGRDGWTEPASVLVVFVSLTHSASGWRIDQVQST